MSEDTAPFALVVDDDPIIRLDASDIMERAGFRPLEAAEVEEAIAILERDWEEVRPLFTDGQPGAGRDGLCLARETAQRWPDIGILVASGDVRPAEGDLPDGAVFINKSFSAQVVHDRLAELLPDGAKLESLKRRAWA